MFTFTVPGVAVPQGSMQHFGKGRVKYRDDLKPWRARVRAEYVRQAGSQRITGGVHTSMEFAMPRPKHHYGTGANAGRIKDSYVNAQHISKPDADKLERAVNDALTLDTGELKGLPRPFEDDAQIVTTDRHKRYVKPGETPGVLVTIRPAY